MNHDINRQLTIFVHYFHAILGKPEYELMQTAWRERNQDARIKNAKEAIALNPECATAYILLAEEEAVDITGNNKSSQSSLAPNKVRP